MHRELRSRKRRKSAVGPGVHILAADEFRVAMMRSAMSSRMLCKIGGRIKGALYSCQSYQPPPKNLLVPLGKALARNPPFHEAAMQPGLPFDRMTEGPSGRPLEERQST